MQRHFCQADQFQADPVVNHPFCRHSQEVLVHSKVTGAGRDDGDSQTGSRQIAIDVMFVKGIQGEVDRFENVSFVCLTLERGCGRVENVQSSICRRLFSALCCPDAAFPFLLG